MEEFIINKNIKKGIFTLSIIIFIIITIILILIAVSKKENNISMYQHQKQKEAYNYKAFELNGNEDSNMECKNGMYYKKYIHMKIIKYIKNYGMTLLMPMKTVFQIIL